jgi:glycosyltransferase involved in cell wall biosynthesis
VLVAICSGLSLRYGGGGERWIIQFANELVKRGHEVDVHCLPFVLDDGGKLDPKKELDPAVHYHEGYFHYVNADVTYVVYHPLSWINFWVKGPKIGGMHSNAYWKPLSWSYGLLPNLAIIANALTSKYELARFKVIHTPLDEYPINHPNVKVIPNFVDSTFHTPSGVKPVQFTVGFSSRKLWSKGYDIWQQLKPLLEKNNIKTMETGGLTDEQLGKFYDDCHIIFVPARVDTFGLSIIESILWGKSIPLVSTVLAHRALGLPLFYADTADSAYRRISEIKEMWENGIYTIYSNILYSQAMKFDKKQVIDQLENMLNEVANAG